MDTYDAYERLCYLYRPTKLLVVINLQNSKVKKLNFVVRQASKQFSIFHSLLEFFTVINIHIAQYTFVNTFYCIYNLSKVSAKGPKIAQQDYSYT